MAFFTLMHEEFPTEE